MGDGGGEEVRPAGEGAANEQAVAVRAVFFVHARSRGQGEAAGRALIIGPFAAGVMEFVSAPHAAQRVEGILRNHAGRDVAEALRAAVETGTCRQKTGHGVLAVVEEQGAAEQHEAAAFGVDGSICQRQRADLFEMGRGADGVGKKFRVSAAEVEAVELRPGGVVEEIQADKIGTRVAQRLKILFVVEPHGSVLHVAYAGASGGNALRRVVFGNIGKRRRGARKGEKNARIGVFFQRVGQLVEHGVKGRIGRVQGEAHVPLRQGIAAEAGKNAEHGNVGIAFDGPAQHGAVTLSGHVVQNDARKVQILLEIRHAGNDGRRGAGHFGAVHGEHHGGLQKLRHMRRGTGTLKVASVEEAAVAFNDGDVGPAPGADAAELTCEGLVAQKVRVKAGGRLSRSQGEPGVVDVVRPFFAGLHGESPPGEEAGESERNQSFAASAGESGNDESRLLHGKKRKKVRKKGKIPKDLPLEVPACWKGAVGRLESGPSESRRGGGDIIRLLQWHPACRRP